MLEPSTAPSSRWQSRLRRLGARARGALLFPLGILAALAAVWLYQYVVPPPLPLTEQQVSDTVAQAMASATLPPAASALVYQVIQPSLVLIESETEHAGAETDNSLGSGVVVDMAGDILTSLHVVEDASAIHVTFFDGTQSIAQIITQQPENDIAVIRAEAPPAQLFPATLGNPNAMSVGDAAFVVGNPFGLYSSMTTGVISGFNRSFKPLNSSREIDGLIQIDAAVNPGNSGGPLLNRFGQVVGIVAGLVNPTEQNVFIGIGFAVPIDVAGGAAGLPQY
jgi:S1-C subfamily serine protease